MKKHELYLIVVICSIIFLTRVPFLLPGYGEDPDSYRNVMAGKIIAKTGEYIYSRPPGYPVVEYLIALTPAKTSPFFSNAISAFFGCVAFVFFALILRWFRIKNYLLISSAFALTPVVYINSVCTMDYIFALAFVLGSAYFILMHRPIIAGILLGLATGSRITSVVMLLPLAVWIYQNDGNSFKSKRLLIFIASAIVTSFICFIPVIFRYGTSFFTFSDYTSYPPINEVIEIGIFSVWGRTSLVGFLGLFFLFPFIFNYIKLKFNDLYIRKGIILSLLTIILYTITFLRLPLESAYLLPVIPFLLLALGLLVPPKYLVWFSILLCVSSFVMIGKNGLTINGPIIGDNLARKSELKQIKEIIEEVNNLNENAVIVVNWRILKIYLEITGEPEYNLYNIYNISNASFLTCKYPFCHEYVYSIPSIDSYKQYIAQGRTVYFLSDVIKNYQDMYHINLKQLGVKNQDSLIVK